MIGDFHFLRSWAFAFLLPGAVLLWLIWRRQTISRAWRGIVAPHLLPYLVSDRRGSSGNVPIMLVAVGWILTTLALAGPTWRREPSPFADDTAALAIVLKVTPSMKTEDVQPNRLARSVQKIHDLLARRPGAKTALIAYSGSAHLVMPLTTDAAIIDLFAGALDPKVMPSDGDAAADAMKLADQSIRDAGSGSILWIADNLAPEERQALSHWRLSSRTSVRLLAPLYGGPELAKLQSAATVVGVNSVRLTADDADVDALAREAKFSNVSSGETGGRWEEGGYWLVPLLALIMLPFARRGWMVSTAAKT
jgi:Ca-activated chloride channel homolog